MMILARRRTRVLIRIPNRVRYIVNSDSLVNRVWFNSYAVAHYGLSSLYGATYFIRSHTPFDLNFIDWDFYSDYFEIEE